ncbi:MAG: Txe/YoeB family addiction module toxin [Kiritimatiellae bacterium]|nr:Txe/YoeB family addiction module toxin [Kiritimatiellia bacterium]
MKKIFAEEAWDDYLSWQVQDKRTLKRINDLIKDIERNGNSGIGKPEPLKHFGGYWSRRINEKDRLVYKIASKDEIWIASCKGHYD